MKPSDCADSLEPLAPVQPAPGRPAPRWAFFRPAPPAAVMISDPARVKAGYRVWQRRVLVSTIIGYAVYYFVRKNLGVAIPAMERDLGISKSQLGMFLTLHGLLYGVSKFVNGFWGDRANARVFMVVGLAASALLNIVFGFSSLVWVFGLVWMANGWFQGMGFPPCARLMTHWFSPKKLVTKMAVWNISHTIGGSVIVVLCGYLVVIDWRWCFLVPAGLALICALYLWKALPDTPPSVGLPEIEETRTDEADEGDRLNFRGLLRRQVFSNRYIWILAGANFFVYAVRYAVLDWGPSMLTQSKHITITHAGWMVAGFEVAGLLGTLVAGWVTARFFGGRCIRVCAIYMVFATISVVLFWCLSSQSMLLNTVLLGTTGFFIYGPQSLVGTAAANLATKRAAASAIGLTGLFGYASTVLSGWGLGALVQHYGWSSGFIGMVICAVAGTVLFLLGWRAQAHGYHRLS